MSVAKSYAQALYQAAVERSGASQSSALCDRVEAQLDEVLGLLSQSRDARVALQSPVTTSKEKAALVQAIGARASLEPIVSQFLTLLASKGRFSVLSEVRESFSTVRLAAEGGVSGRLVSAEPISEADVKALAESFGKRLSKKVAFQVSTDPSLLAGVRITINGVTYDGTLRSQLDRLRDQFVSAAVYQ